MALDVRTKTRIRTVVAVVIGIGVCWAVYYYWPLILPAIASGTERAYDAAREFGGG